MNTQTILNFLLLGLLAFGIIAALAQGDELWAVCFGVAMIQRFVKPTNTGEQNDNP